ncbi:hypothetical protein AAFF_G00030290 [Aldrovandia affinis]|uniref:Uncharacterized protein n=1 Tax=Aldrovandia affinis TaxID=143900 RepID=A0AAD7WG46_9TELE|nr:hypothetical protein AAFF_G00030290 [Aldrovandia affinis]
MEVGGDRKLPFIWRSLLDDDGAPGVCRGPGKVQTGPAGFAEREGEIPAGHDDAEGARHLARFSEDNCELPSIDRRQTRGRARSYLFNMGFPRSDPSPALMMTLISNGGPRLRQEACHFLRYPLSSEETGFS